jgi:membrane-bound ClpP family serine protease
MSPWMQVILAIVIAVLLFGAEIILPGGILGVIGAVLMVVATALAYQHAGPFAALSVAVGSGLFILAFFYFQFRILPKTGLGKRLFLQTTSTGTSVDLAPDSLIGTKGIALAPMTPSGMVSIDGVRYEAIAQSGSIEKGAEVEVVAKDAFRLVVKK